MCVCVCICSCKEGYEGAYCQVAAVSTSELPLLITLSTLLPIAAILVVIVTVVVIYRRLKANQDVKNTQAQHRDIHHAGYDL